LRKSNYDKYPVVPVEKENRSCFAGWDAIGRELKEKLVARRDGVQVLVVECYPGTDDKEVRSNLVAQLPHVLWIDAATLYRSEAEIREMVFPFVTDDRLFGYLSSLTINSYLDAAKIEQTRAQVSALTQGTVIVYGTGAACVLPAFDLLVYADMARWEIQMRMRRKEVNSLGLNNKSDEFALLYKQGFYVDWRVADKLKKELMPRWSYVLDTNIPGAPKLADGKAVLRGMEMAVRRPFRVVPFFDPGPWGGQWMKEVCDLDRSAINYAWCFDCVPEENSLLLGFGEHRVEIPSINVVFYQTSALLGDKVRSRFGDEFPIRFDFLDTMAGGNLSLQVHPLTEYIQAKFGMHYTQDESYYMLDAKEGAFVYLGLNDDVNPDAMLRDLRDAQDGGKPFDADRHVKKWTIRKHDHVSIPAGTVHCSGADSMVLEISATPFNFTFKLWDWDRLGLDGKPRPINIDHGAKVIQWDRTASWVKEHALNLVEPLEQGPGWREERTGLNELQFIETRRHWFTSTVTHHTRGIVNVLNLVEGEEAIVESPDKAFEPFVVHYAETFIVPAAVGAYTIRPYGLAEGKECATVKAYVRV
jgi:mannose-6-phosphate isomerase class I